MSGNKEPELSCLGQRAEGYRSEVKLGIRAKGQVGNQSLNLSQNLMVKKDKSYSANIFVSTNSLVRSRKEKPVAHACGRSYFIA